MFVKTEERAGRTQYFLCIAEQGGSGESWKIMDHSLCLGETLDLSSREWFEILRASSEFRHVPIKDILEAFETYVASRRLPPRTLSGLRKAARESRRESRSGTHSERRSQQDEYVTALWALGLKPGVSPAEIESAFRKAARRHHPDVGGDSARFRALVDARSLLLGRLARPSETA